LAGLDCEWKPVFNKDLEKALHSIGKNNRANTLQVATRDKVFIVEIKDLADQLSQAIVEKFLNNVLFSENLVKLGKYTAKRYVLALN
jgi:hypothetical protein